LYLFLRLFFQFFILFALFANFFPLFFQKIPFFSRLQLTAVAAFGSDYFTFSGASHLRNTVRSEWRPTAATATNDKKSNDLRKYAQK